MIPKAGGRIKRSEAANLPSIWTPDVMSAKGEIIGIAPNLTKCIIINLRPHITTPEYKCNSCTNNDNAQGRPSGTKKTTFNA
jgi:hypothetical protein